MLSCNQWFWIQPTDLVQVRGGDTLFAEEAEDRTKNKQKRKGPAPAVKFQTEGTTRDGGEGGSAEC